MSVTGPVDTFSFSGENASRAGASALRKIKPLSETMPMPKLAEAIASLSDMSAQAAIEYEKAAIAILRQEIAAAEASVAAANELADKLEQHMANEVPIPLPNFFRRKN
jgi:hypothetical protein